MARLCTRSMIARDRVPSRWPRMFLFLKYTIRVFTRRARRSSSKLLSHCAVRNFNSISGRPSTHAARRRLAEMADGSHSATSSGFGLEFQSAVGFCPASVWICKAPGMYTDLKASQFCIFSCNIMRWSRRAVVCRDFGMPSCSVAKVFRTRLLTEWGG